MTDRFHSLVVVLEQDIREDDAQNLIKAIKLLRGVADVSGAVADLASHTAEVRARTALGQQILDVLFPEKPQG